MVCVAMKTSLCVFMLCMIWAGAVKAIGEGLHKEHQQHRRGFRFGAADRFSHGFGKRSHGTDSDSDDITNADLLTDKRGFRNGAADRFSHGFGKRLSDDIQDTSNLSEHKRGFRNGAADRFSHGFGKREMDNSITELTDKRGFRNGAADRFSHGFGKRFNDYSINDEFAEGAAKRGFRNGAADRFSHGFGKRFNSLEDLATEGELLTVSDMATLLSNHHNLAEFIIQRFMDTNGNGLIDKEELFRHSDH